MKQLGNLAVVCARRQDVLLQILGGAATVYVGSGPGRAAMAADWTDDRRISEIIRELNFGQYSKKGAGTDEIFGDLRRPA